MTTVLILSNCPPKLRGDMTKWFVEINSGVYVGSLNNRVREGIWKRVCDNIKGGQATMVFHADNEQQMDFYVHNTTWEAVDLDGIKLMRRPSPEHLAKRAEPALKPGFSNAAKSRFMRGTNRTVAKSDGYVIIDIETSGLDLQSDRIIEYAAIKVENNCIVEEFEVLSSQDVKLSKDIVELTGITSELLSSEGKAPEAALKAFLDFVGRSRIIGHNLSFDMPFLVRECQRYKLSPPSGRCDDTLKLSRRKLSGIANHKLSTLASHFNLSTDGMHRALSDCRILHEVYLKLMEMQ